MAEKILFISPHTDDAELGCGGTMAKMAREGNDVYIAAFSKCEKSVPEGFAKDVLVKEMKEAAKALGIKGGNVMIFGYEVREFPEKRQEILEELFALNRKIRPVKVFVPCSSDLHQDHHTIYGEARRAFRESSIYGYEQPWNCLEFWGNAVMAISKEDLEKKVSAIACYKSQEFRNYSKGEVFESLARIRGLRANTEYAEAFEAIQIVER
ncbi:LmbE family protein [Candidatus Peregrinibacteria bacterium CG10_big_fil_rev_8_21_14_0_10_54_7]|nr:MAG: LmbE family protein [Candidatus Peregrinibacteria bacterium CG10_big_fil_rev_8_21_14_0_10_54_7]